MKINHRQLVAQLATSDNPRGKNLDSLDVSIVLARLGAKLRDFSSPAEALEILNHIVQKCGRSKKVLSLLAGLMLLTGCATTPTATTVASYIADARDIASVGTTAVLLENPSLRHELVLTRDSLAVLESLPAGNVSVDDLLRALSNLPLEQLQSAKGKVYVTAGRIIVRRFIGFATGPSLDVGASGYVQQFAAALRQGIDEGLR